MSATQRRHVVGAVATLLASGCARLVTLDPVTVSKRNDETWTVRSEPKVAAPVDAAGAPPVPQVVQPLPFARRPEVTEALRSPPDDQGIPSSLYAVDPLLSAHRRERESQTRARHQVGAGIIVSGLFTGGLSAWALASGASYGDDPRTQSYAGQLIADGVILGVLSLSELIGGIVLAASSSDAGPLHHYYRETYAAPAAPGDAP
ncbi:MAG: hypothetical protein JWM82_2997 [Myxococcales bacterium]|nr:hypothetical protein [Myxococcales bacterium]